MGSSEAKKVIASLGRTHVLRFWLLYLENVNNFFILIRYFTFFNDNYAIVKDPENSVKHLN